MLNYLEIFDIIRHIMIFLGGYSMVLKIAICDDNPSICLDLEKVLRQIEKVNKYNFEIKIFYSIEELK